MGARLLQIHNGLPGHVVTRLPGFDYQHHAIYLSRQNGGIGHGHSRLVGCVQDGDASLLALDSIDTINADAHPADAL